MSISLTNLSNILFLDIETVSSHQSFQAMSDAMKHQWENKCKIKNWDVPIDDPLEDPISSLYNQKAGIFAEFAKIVCISVGFCKCDKYEIIEFRLRSFCGDDETMILSDFTKLLTKYYYHPGHHFICGHNIREFDIPFICRRMKINQLKLPVLLDIAGKKPWQTPQFLDTMEMWKFGDYKNFTSLELLATLFDIPSPKDDLDGSKVSQVYWKDQNLKCISEYCEKDVLTTARLFLKLEGLPDISDKSIQYIS